LFLVLKESPAKRASQKKETPKKKQQISNSSRPKGKKIATLSAKKGTRPTKQKPSTELAKPVENTKISGGNTVQELSLSMRPRDEVVTYDEIDFQLKEISGPPNQVMIGPLSLTRFEKARITGARSLQLSLGAPALVAITDGITDSISLAVAELKAKALPISIRRILPNGLYQDIPIDWL
jgi:DNA-directed RNA polymerases I, II, and III subunit RPABC2